MNLIRVKVLSSFLSEKGEKKIGGISEINKKDQHGLSLEQYEDLGLEVPKDSSHHKKDSELDLDEDDIEIIESDAYFLAEDFKLVVAREDFGSTIYLKDGTSLDVAETPRKIVNKLKSINN